MSAPLLEVQGLCRGYGELKVLHSVSFDLRAGEILSLLGPNGSGKSTLLKCVAGILPPRSKGSEGRVLLDGEDLGLRDLAWRSRRIAYVGADIVAQFPITAEQAVLLGRSCGGGGSLFRLSTSEDLARVEQAMRRAFCWELRGRDLQTLSGGERQLVAVARALAQGARVLLLDEAFSRMDLHHQAAMGRLVTELAGQGYAILLVSHDINIASEWAHTALLLKKGSVVARGPIRQALSERALRELYPGCDLMVGVSPASGAPKVFFGTGTPEAPPGA